MKSTRQEALWLCFILLLALLIRLPGIFYGLPLHLFADEEVNIYGALEMLRLHTFLPVVNPSAFTILYEPPMLAYVFAVIFTPLLAIVYLLSGHQTLSHFITTVTLNPSFLWVIARSCNVGTSLGSIYLSYTISRRIFKNTIAALATAFFVTTSVTDVALASTARIWELGTFLSLVSFLLVMKFLEDRAHPLWLGVLAGVVLGLSFGTNYLLYFFPLIGLFLVVYLWNEKRDGKFVIARIAPFLASFAIVALLFLVIAPYPLHYQSLVHLKAAPMSFLGLVEFFALSLWNYETPILIFAAIGLFFLWKKRKDVALTYTVFLLALIPGMYIASISVNQERYLQPFIAAVAFIAGYGVAILLTLKRKIFWQVSAVVLICYFVAVYIPYDTLLLRHDTRNQATVWIQKNIPTGSTIIVDSTALQLQSTPHAVALVQSVAGPSALRSADQIVLNSATTTNAYNAISLYLVPTTAQLAVITSAVTNLPSPTYVVTDSWTDSNALHSLLQNATVLKQFSNGLKVSMNGLFIGGDSSISTVHILQLLWQSKNFGPNISMYVVKGSI